MVTRWLGHLSNSIEVEGVESKCFLSKRLVNSLTQSMSNSLAHFRAFSGVSSAGGWAHAHVVLADQVGRAQCASHEILGAAAPEQLGETFALWIVFFGFFGSQIYVAFRCLTDFSVTGVTASVKIALADTAELKLPRLACTSHLFAICHGCGVRSMLGSRLGVNGPISNKSSKSTTGSALVCTSIYVCRYICISHVYKHFDILGGFLRALARGSVSERLVSPGLAELVRDLQLERNPRRNKHCALQGATTEKFFNKTALFTIDHFESWSHRILPFYPPQKEATPFAVPFSVFSPLDWLGSICKSMVGSRASGAADERLQEILKELAANLYSFQVAKKVFWSNFDFLLLPMVFLEHFKEWRSKLVFLIFPWNFQGSNAKVRVPVPKIKLPSLPGAGLRRLLHKERSPAERSDGSMGLVLKQPAVSKGRQWRQ